MRLNILREGLLICSLLWGTVLCSGHDAQLTKRQPPPPPIAPVTTTVTITSRWTVTETTTTTITGAPTSVNVVTVTSTESATTTSTKTITIQPSDVQEAPVQRRQAGPPTVTVSVTSWDWQDTTTTFTVTSTVMPAQTFTVTNPTTTTQTTTEFSTIVTEQTITASSTSSPTSDTQAVPVSNRGNTMNKAKPPNIELILGASFAALVGAIGIFVLAYLFSKKKHETALRKESCGVESQKFGKSARAGATGLLGVVLGKKVRRKSSAVRYNNLPTSENSAISQLINSPLPPAPPPPPPPPHSPPPQLPLLNINPPETLDFNCNYSFGSPVSSIGGDREIQIHAYTSDIAINRMSPAPPYSASPPDALAYVTAMAKAEEERARPGSLEYIKTGGNMGMYALNRKPLPTP